MDMEYDRDKSRMICTWEEPVQAVFQGRTVQIRKKRSRRLRINRSGSIPERELDKLGNAARTKAVQRFQAALERLGLFDQEMDIRRCVHCGHGHEIKASYDIGKRTLSWFCPQARETGQ